GEGEAFGVLMLTSEHVSKAIAAVADDWGSGHIVVEDDASPIGRDGRRDVGSLAEGELDGRAALEPLLPEVLVPSARRREDDARSIGVKGDEGVLPAVVGEASLAAAVDPDEVDVGGKVRRQALALDDGVGDVLADGVAAREDDLVARPRPF